MQVLGYYNQRGFKGFWPRIIINPLTYETRNNPQPNISLFEPLSYKAEEILEEYLITLTHTKKRCFTFHVFIEPVIDYSRQDEYFSTESIHSSTLSCHIQYKEFMAADEQQRLSMILTACQLLMEYWDSAYKSPSDINVGVFANNIKQFLVSKGYYLNDHSFFYKPTTNINLRIYRINGIQSDKEKAIYDVEKLESYLTNNLIDQNFGHPVRHFVFRQDIFKPEGAASHGTDKDIYYSPKTRFFLIPVYFEYDQLIQQSPEEQLLDLKTKMKATLDFIKTSKKIPKKFDAQSFCSFVGELLDKYSG